MFLDDTACNLASLNLLKFYDAATGRFDVDSFRHASRLWTLILEISVYMAQFPSVSVAQKSYDFRTLGLGYANMGSLLMVQGIALRFAGRPGPVRRRLPPSCTPPATPRPPRSPPEVGPFPRYDANRDAMLRVVRNHRRAAYNAPHARVRGADHPAGRHRRAILPRLPAGGGPPRVRPNGGAGREVRLSQRPGHVHRPDRHHRPGHGLRHHRRRAGLRPGEVQEAGRRRLLQDHQRLHPARPGPPRLHARNRSKTSSATAAAPARCTAARTSTPPPSGPRASPTTCSRTSRRSCPASSSCPSPSIAGRSATTCCVEQTRLHHGADRGAELRPADRPRLHARSRSTRPTPTSAAR